MTYDIYRGKFDRRLRLAIRAGAGLPAHLAAEDWELRKGVEILSGDAAAQVNAWGFCTFPKSEEDAT
jgi:hypothetical protein